MTNFLPDNYKVPTTSNYMKFQKGENRFRILSKAVVGYEYWNNDGKPVRLHEQPDELPADIGHDKKGNPNPLRHFWAFIVWNYTDERVQILEITQITIMNGIKLYVENPKWGNPSGYDIIVTRTGESMNTTEYTVTVDPKSEPEQKIMDEWRKREGKINLNALFEGADPFGAAKVESSKPEEVGGVPYPDEDISPNDIPF